MIVTSGGWLTAVVADDEAAIRVVAKESVEAKVDGDNVELLE